jgi:hypothetical protein
MDPVATLPTEFNPLEATLPTEFNPLEATLPTEFNPLEAIDNGFIPYIP